MRTFTTQRSLLFTLALLGAAAVGVSPAGAQTYGWSRYGVGYTGSAPNMLGGVSAYVLFPSMRGFGIYVDTKWDIDSPAKDPYFLTNMTRQQVEDQVTGALYQQKRESWRGFFNVAIVKPVTPGLMLYAGGGYSRREWFYSYQDPSEQLGQLGLFWVQAPELTGNDVNVMVGAFLRMGRYIAFQTGFETRPGGFTLGATIKFPPH